VKLSSFHGRVGAVALAGALALTLAACGSDNPTGDAPTTGETSGNGGSGDSEAPALSGELNGAGSSAQEKAMDAWRAGFQSENPDVAVNYDPVGSGGGRTQFLDGATDWAGSDAAMSADEVTKGQERCNGEAYDIPVYISPIAVAFNLEGIDSLNLSPATIAGIFTGAITSWDAPEIAADNPDVELPALAITAVHRSEGSGTTKNFTDYLSKTAPDIWTYEPADDWPLEGGESAQGTSGVVQTIQGGNGTIGYADESGVGDLGQASIKVGDAWVAPSAEGAAIAVDASPRDDSRSEHDIVINIDRTTTEADAYPLLLVSYAIFCDTYESQEKADLVKGLLSYIVSEQGQSEAQSAAGSAPISDDLRTDVQAAIDTIGA